MLFHKNVYEWISTLQKYEYVEVHPKIDIIVPTNWHTFSKRCVYYYFSQKHT